MLENYLSPRIPSTRSARLSLTLAAALGLLASAPAFAHVTLEKTVSAPGAGYKAIFRVGHGCEGSPTVSLKIEIPEGVIAAKPMPKAGWTLEIAKAAYEKSHDYYGKPMSEGARAITFTGRLADDQYDEFVISSYVAKDVAAGTPLYFPVTQICEVGAHRWTEIPAAGQDSHALKEPAPFIRVVASEQQAAAAPLKAGSLSLAHLWLREPPPAVKSAGGYLTISNGGQTADRLLAVESGIAGKIEVHEMSNVDGVMHMQALPSGLEIAPGATIELKPGGYHVMFTGLKEPLKAGASIPATLVFEKAGRVAVTFPVEKAQSPGGSASQEEHHH